MKVTRKDTKEPELFRIADIEKGKCFTIDVSKGTFNKIYLKTEEGHVQLDTGEYREDSLSRNDKCARIVDVEAVVHG